MSFDPVALFFPAGDPLKDEYFRTRGFRQAVSNGQQGWLSTAELYRPCPEHQNNRCNIYEKRPQICRNFPVSPDQIKNTPCSYWFEDESGENRPIGGDASPYPVNFQNFNITKEMNPIVRPVPQDEIEGIHEVQTQGLSN